MNEMMIATPPDRTLEWPCWKTGTSRRHPSLTRKRWVSEVAGLSLDFEFELRDDNADLKFKEGLKFKELSKEDFELKEDFH